MLDKAASIIASALVVLGITTLVLPGRGQEAGTIIKEGSSGAARIANALIGRG